jgi:hypothetical protein
MTRQLPAIAAALLAAALSAAPAQAAEAVPSRDESKPVTAARVGGSPADRAFRTAVQESGDRFRRARADCAKRPAAERSACVKSARDELNRTRREAKAAHDAAQKKR